MKDRHPGQPLPLNFEKITSTVAVLSAAHNTALRRGCRSIYCCGTLCYFQTLSVFKGFLTRRDMIWCQLLSRNLGSSCPSKITSSMLQCCQLHTPPHCAEVADHILLWHALLFSNIFSVQGILVWVCLYSIPIVVNYGTADAWT